MALLPAVINRFLGRETEQPVAPIREAAPESDGAKPIEGMISRSAESNWMPAAYLKVIAANPDTILARDGWQGFKLYDQLLDDDTVFGSLQQRRLAITSKDWDVAPGDEEDPQSVKAAEDFRAMLKQMRFDHVTGLLHYGVWFGFAVGEAIWTTKTHEGREIVWLDDIVVPDRRWFGFTTEGELRYTASLLNAGGDILPDNKFLTIRTGGNHDFAFYGLGLAHWCYWPIFFKRSALKFWALYLEKFGMPTVAMEFGPADTDEIKAGKLAAGVAIGQDRAVLVPEGMLENERVKLIEAERSGSGASSYKEFVTMQDEALMRVILGQPGTSKGVSSGLNSNQASEHKDVRDEIVKADLDLICEALNRTVAKWVTAWNYGPDVAPPTVYRVLSDPEDLNTVADRDVKLSGIGIKRTEQSIADTYGDGYEYQPPADPVEVAAKVAAIKGGGKPGGAPDPKDDPGALAFSADEDQAIDRLIAKLVEDTNPFFAAIAEQLRDDLQGVTSLEGARVALLSAFERFPVQKLAELTGLPMMAERAAAVIGADNEVVA